MVLSSLLTNLPEQPASRRSAGCSAQSRDYDRTFGPSFILRLRLLVIYFEAYEQEDCRESLRNCPPVQPCKVRLIRPLQYCLYTTG